MSFARGTPVWSGQQSTPIETIQRGARVLTCAGVTHPVSSMAPRPGRVRRWVELQFDDFVVMATTEQPVLTPRGWMRAAALAAGDPVVEFVLKGLGAANGLWGDEKAWRERLSKADRRALCIGPWPKANLHKLCATLPVKGVIPQDTEPIEAFDILFAPSLPHGYVVHRLIVRDGTEPPELADLGRPSR